MQIPLGVEPKFGRLVRHLERWAAVHPFSYRLIVLILALIGYAYLMGMAFVVLAAALYIAFHIPLLLFVPALALYVLGPFFALAGIVIGALWVKIEPPTGYDVTRNTAPALFALLDTVRRAARSPRIHRVLIGPEMNAGVSAVPRLGVFGWNRNYLIIGLPLMQSVNDSEFAAVIAHEFGHLAGRYGWFRSWVYRLRMTWWRIGDALQRRARWSRWFFMPFYALYVPYFNAYSFVLARADEYEADRMSAEVAGAAAAASALVRVDIVGHYLASRFWPSLYRAANNYAEPPYLPHARLREELGKPLSGTDGTDGYNVALARSTDLSDTHPSLPDRLKAIGATAAPAPPPAQSAAAALLGAELLAKITDSLDSRWRGMTLEGWKSHYRSSREDRRLLTELEAKAAAETPTPDQRLKRAKLAEQFLGEEQAIPLYREIVAADSSAARARFDLGRILIDRNDAEGLPLLEAAMAADDRLTMAACELVYLYMMRAGRAQEAEAYRVRLIDQRALEERAAEQRIAPRWRDRFEEHGLGQEDLSRLVEQLRTYHAVRRAYLLRKRVSILPHRPYYVLLVRSTTSIRNLDYSLAQLLANAIEFPSDAYVLHLTWKTSWLLWRCRRLPTALVLSKY